MRKKINNKVLITGISGFIGSSVAEHFLHRKFVVAGLSRSKTNIVACPTFKTSYSVEEIAKIVADFRPNILIHAAGAASVDESIKNPSKDFEASVVLFQSLLEGVRKSGHKLVVVLLSSAAVYGNPVKLPINEDSALRPISPYGYHKLICEILAREYSASFDISTLVLRLFSVFGPRQKRLLLWELFDQFQNKTRVEIEGTGTESRDYIYIDDLAACIEKVLSRLNDSHTVLNIAAGTSVTVSEVVFKIKDYLNSDKPVIFNGKYRVGNPNSWLADISKYKKMAGTNNISNFDERLKWNLKQWLK